MTLGYLHNLDHPLVLEGTDNAGSQAQCLRLKAVSLSDLDHSEERVG